MGKHFFYFDFFRFLKNGSSEFKLEFKVYGPWDSLTFDMRHIVVKSLLSKLFINKKGHIYLFRTSNTACALTFFVRVQTLFEGPENLGWC